MQFVDDKFYNWYNRAIGVIGFVLVVITALAWTMPNLEFLRVSWGFQPIIGVIGLAQCVYAFFFYGRQSSPWVACLIGSMIISLANIGLVHNSGQFHSWFLITWNMQVFMAGVFGLYCLVGCSFMITIYYVLLATGPFGSHGLSDPYTYGAVLTTYAINAISYGFWRRMYVDQESQKISQLTGQLKNKQLQTEILVQSISDGMIVTDTEGKITLVNPAAAAMTGWAVNEAIGIDIAAVAKFAKEDGTELTEAEDPFKRVLRDKQPVDQILQLKHRTDKTPRIVSMVISPIITAKTNELAGTAAVMRDVSAAREEEHRRADFISTASHEMRTPVAAIEGYLQLALNEKVSRIDAKARDYLTKSLESTHRLGTLFQDLLTSAKAEDGRLVSHPRVVEMGEYLETITEGLKFAAEKKGLLVDFTVGSNDQAGNKMVKPLYYTHIDPDRMQEVITNLFDNAVKYSENGKISIALTGNDDLVQFYIRDTGHGIPAEDVPHLFQKFYRVDNSSTRTIGGTGLGLFICRKIVELYHGRIWVESELNKGSTFYINLPRLSSQKAAELQTKEQQTVQ